MPIDASIPLQSRPQLTSPMELVSNLFALKNQQQEGRLREQQITAAQTADDDRRQQMAVRDRTQQQQAAIDRLMQTAFKDDPETGVSTFDRGAFEQGLVRQNMGHLYPQMAETLDKLDASTAKIASERRGLLARSIFAVQQAGNTPEAVMTAAAYLKKNGAITNDRLQPVLDAVSADPSPEAIGKVMAKLGQGLPEYRDIVNAEEKRKTDLAKAGADAKKTGLEADKIAAEIAGTLPANPGQAETARHNRAIEGIERTKAANAQNDVTDLTPAGLDAAALNYAKTGQLPPLGMGDKQTRKKIINRAAEMMPGLDIATAKADYDANKGALTALQKQRDAIGAFEQTAMRNIDVFLKQAEKVVDTGSPLLNIPVRMVTGKLLGAEDQAAYDAARQVAVNEIAKITSNPNLSGTLSDSARHEVDAFNPQNATLKQSIAVMKLLKQDMQNRTHALDDQIGGIKGRLKAGAPDAGAGVKPKYRYNPVTGQAEEIKP